MMDTAEFLKSTHAHIAAMIAIDDAGKECFGGFGSYAWALTDKGIEMYALHVKPEEAWMAAMVTAAKPTTSHMIFGLDRNAKPEQGTTLTSLVAGFFYERDTGAAFQPFTVEYAMKPEKRVLWFNWGNRFWNAVIEFEMAQVARVLLQKLEERDAK